MKLKLTKWLRIETDTLDTNYHGPNSTTLRRTWLFVRMGSFAKYWSLYLYLGDGSTYRIGVCFPRWIGEWPKQSKDTRP